MLIQCNSRILKGASMRLRMLYEDIFSVSWYPFPWQWKVRIVIWHIVWKKNTLETCLSKRLCYTCPLQLGLQEADWLCGAEEPRSHLLHELSPAVSLLHQWTQKGQSTWGSISKPTQAQIAMVIRVELLIHKLCKTEDSCNTIVYE